MTTSPYVIALELLRQEGIVSPTRLKNAIGWSDGLEKTPDELLAELMDYFVNDLGIAKRVKQGWQGLDGLGRPYKPSKEALALPACKFNPTPRRSANRITASKESNCNHDTAKAIIEAMEEGSALRPACQAQGITVDAMNTWRRFRPDLDSRIRRLIKNNGNSRSVATQEKLRQAMELVKAGKTQREITKTLKCGKRIVLEAKERLKQ